MSIFGLMNKHSKQISRCPLCNAEEKARFIGYKLNGPQGLFPQRNYKAAEKVFCCKQCDLFYNNPQVRLNEEVFNQDDSLLELTTLPADHIKSVAGYADTLEFLKDKARLSPGAKVLDMGSGVGRVAFALKKAGYETYAVEPKKQLFDYAVANDLIDKDRSFNKSFESAEFERESLDFIFLEPLHHFTDPHAAIQKTLEWLKPGGYLHLEVVNSRWLYKNVLSLFYRFTLRKHVPYTSALRKPFNACEYSAKSFKVYSALNNLQVSQLSSYACDTFISNKFLDKWLSRYMRRFNQGMELTVILKKQ